MFKMTKDYRTDRSSRVRNERGVATLEYAVMLFLVSLAVAGFGDQISGTVTGVFEQVMTTLT